MYTRLFALFWGLFFLISPCAQAVIRDGGVDPANLGQGGWLYYMSNETNHLQGVIPSVTNEDTLFAYLKSQNFQYVIVKCGISNMLWNNGSVYSVASGNCQLNSNLCYYAHKNGLLIFGSNRSGGDKSDAQVLIDTNEINGEIAVADYTFNAGADGFIWDAESTWESGNLLLGTNGPNLAWYMCSTVRSHWTNKFLAHNPYDTLYLHSSYPFKEFGYWCDCVMPQVYHHSASKGNAIAAIQWTDYNYKKWQDSLLGTSSVINGQTIYWTNSIKPLVMMRDVYGTNNGTIYPDSDVLGFMDYLVADPNCVTAGGYLGSDYFRCGTYSIGQWANMKASTIGIISNRVNNIILDDAAAVVSGSWTPVKTIDANNSTVIFSGAGTNNSTGTDTNSFGTNYWFKAQGPGSDYVQYRPNVLVSGDYKLYQWHPYRTDASAAIPFLITYNGGSTTVFANQQTNDGNWSYVGTFPFAAGTNGSIRITDAVAEPSAVAMVDGLKMVYVPNSTVPTAPSGLVATAAGMSQIDLHWQDNSTNETSFVLARSLVSGGPYEDIATNSANVTNYSNTGLSAGTTYYYVVRAVNSAGASPVSNQASATTATGAPVISQQPQSQTVVVSQSATFTVVATGSGTLNYQWRFGAVNIPNATTSSYTRTNAQYSDAGSYSVVVGNAFGSVTSSNAMLTVVAPTPPSITSQPQSQTIVAGQTASFSVSASGTAPLSYQWYKNGSALAGAIDSAFSKSNAQGVDVGSYTVVVTNVAGSASSSAAVLVVNYTLTTASVGNGGVSKSPDLTSYSSNAVVTLTATPAPGASFTGWSSDASGTSNPLNVTMTANKNITANFIGGVSDIIIDNVDSGFATSGLWQSSSFSTDKYGADYRFASTVNGGTSNVTYTPNIAQTGYYDVYIWYPQGSNRSTAAPWTVVYAGGSVTTYVNQTNNGGAWRQIASEKKFTARGNGNVQLSNNTSESGKVVLADAVKLVYAAIQTPFVTSQPQSQSVGYAAPVTFTTSAVGAPSFNYQWQFNGSDIPGATGSSFTIERATTPYAGSYAVLVSDSVGAALSNPAELVVADPVITITSISKGTNGQTHLHITGDPVNFILEATTNLADWTQLTASSTTNGPVDYYDSDLTAGHRFYRGRVTP